VGFFHVTVVLKNGKIKPVQEFGVC